MADLNRSRIFLGNRVLGHVSTHVPVVARYIKSRGENLLVTSVGRWFHTYGCDHFRLLSVSSEHPSPIACITGDNFHIYTACDKEIYAWRRGYELKHKYVGHDASIHLMLPFGAHLLSVDKANVLKVWDIKDESLYLELGFDFSTFHITTMIHPATYLNKILFGSDQGQLQLWNIRTSKLIMTFKGWKSSVVVLEQAPAVDVVAVGLASGRIILHNIKFDETVMEFLHDWGSVTTISFRFDGEPIMVTGSSSGHIVLWNLEEQRVSSQIESAHSSAVAGLICLPSEPLMVSNSGDNSLKLWIFDMSDGGPRLLRIREGHSSPPTVVRYCEPTGANILSASSDSTLHIMNTITETFNKSMGKASYNRKASKKKKRLAHDSLIMPPITDISTCMQRDKQWDSIAAVHSSLYVVTTWSYDKMKMGEHKLKPKNFEKGTQATCLTVTHCGNFVIIGYTNGHVYKFNMQSGIERGHYGNVHGAHKGAVRGVETDTLNQRVITAGADDKLRFWHFKNAIVPFHVLHLEQPVAFTRCHRESSLLALCNDDHSITLIDIDTMITVREFQRHTAKINDAVFSPESRWLISSSMDCTVCTWDIPSGQLVDIFELEDACTSLSISPTGDFLATAHVGQLGICLWANRTLYFKVNLRPLDAEITDVPKLDLPSTSLLDTKETLEDLEQLNLTGEPEFKSPEQINTDLITMSNLPTSRWQNLLHLDIVKKRNKPKVPVTIPKSAPFFLPTVASLQVKFDLTNVKKTSETSKILMPDLLINLTTFGKLLDSVSNDDFTECINTIKTFSASNIDFEINSLGTEGGGSLRVVEQFMKMINAMLSSNKDFELAQSYLSVFLKVLSKDIAKNHVLGHLLHDIEAKQAAGWTKLQDMFFYNTSVIKSLKNM